MPSPQANNFRASAGNSSGSGIERFHFLFRANLPRRQEYECSHTGLPLWAKPTPDRCLRSVSDELVLSSAEALEPAEAAKDASPALSESFPSEVGHDDGEAEVPQKVIFEANSHPVEADVDEETSVHVLPVPRHNDDWRRRCRHIERFQGRRRMRRTTADFRSDRRLVSTTSLHRRGV